MSLGDWAFGGLFSSCPYLVHPFPISFNDVQTQRVMHVFARHDAAVFIGCVAVAGKNGNKAILKPT